MKHLFLSHSHITYLVALSVIKRLELNREDVAFLTTRKYNISEFDFIDLNAEFDKLNGTNYSNFFKRKRVIQEVDQKINELNIQEYTVYLPHLAHPLFQILASKNSCKKINIIEEGLNCLSERIYNEERSLKKYFIHLVFNKSGIYGNKRFFKANTNIDFRYFDSGKSPVFYGISSMSFKHVHGFKKEIVELVKPKGISKKIVIPDGASILLLESIIEQDGLNNDVFFNSIETIASQIKTNKLYLKYHPYQNHENRARITKILESKFSIEVLGDDIILEYQLLLSKDLKVYGFTTSLLFYAKLFGHSVKSFIELWERDRKFQHFRAFNDFDLKKVLEENFDNEK